MKPHMAKGSRPRSAVPGCLSGWAPATALLLAVTTSCTGSAPGNGAVAVGKPGTAGVGDRLFPGLGNGGYDVVHYGLTLDYVPETNHLKGTAIITAQATQDLSRFNLDLSGLRVRTTTVQGAKAQVARSGDELLVKPAKTVRNREVFKTVVTYDGTPRTLKDDDGGLEGWIETDDGSTALGQQSGSMTWFPGNHHPSDKATYDITVTVPKDEDGDPYDVISNGELITEEDKGKTVTRHWRTEEPMASYLAHVSIGYFETHKRRTDDDVPVYVAIDPDEAEDSADVPDLVPEIVDWVGKRFGPYPSPLPVPSSTICPGSTTPWRPRPSPTSARRPTRRCSCTNWHTSGSATPSPRASGRTCGSARVWPPTRSGSGKRSGATGAPRRSSRTTTTARTPRARVSGRSRRMDPPSAGRVSDPPVYGRGAMVVHKVRRAVGDETFFDILRTWTRQHRHGNADTRQFIALCESKSGKDLTALFNTWLFDKKKPSRM